MSKPRSKDVQYTIFFGIALILCLVAVIDPFRTVGRSQQFLLGLIFGPLSIGYAFYGLWNGRFPELSRSIRSGSPLQFWLCFWTFLILGSGVTFLVLKELTARWSG